MDKDNVTVTVLNPGCDLSSKSGSPDTLVTDTTIKHTANHQLLNNDQIFIYPNPFKDNLIIDITIGEEQPVGIDILDLYGKSVYRQDTERLTAGGHSFEWDGTGMAGGVYICRVTIGNNLTSIRIVLIK